MFIAVLFRQALGILVQPWPMQESESGKNSMDPPKGIRGNQVKTMWIWGILGSELTDS